MAPSRAFIVLLVVQILLMLPLISCHAEEITNTLVPAEQLGLTPVLVRNMSGCVEAEVTSDGAISLLPLCPGEAVLIVCNTYSESAEIVVSVNDDLMLTYTLRSFEAPKAYANVLDYGAVGTDKTDDTLAIQKAIDSLPEGGTVYFPTGVYTVSNLIIREGIQLRLAGCLPDATVGYTEQIATWVNSGELAILRTNYGNNHMFYNLDKGEYCTEGASSFSFSGGMIDCRGGTMAFVWACADDVLLENCIIKDNPNNHAIQIDGCSNVVIRNVMFAGYEYGGINTRETIQIEPTTAGAISGNYATSPVKCKDGDFHFNRNIVITGCYFGKSDKCGPHLTPVGHHSITGGKTVVDGLEFSGNVVDNPLLYGMHLLNYANVKVVDNTFISDGQTKVLEKDTALICIATQTKDRAYTTQKGIAVEYARANELHANKHIEISNNHFILGGGTMMRVLHIEGTTFAPGATPVRKLIRADVFGDEPYAYTGYLINQNYVDDVRFCDNQITINGATGYDDYLMYASRVYDFVCTDNDLSAENSYTSASTLDDTVILALKSAYVKNGEDRVMVIEAQAEGGSIYLVDWTGAAIDFPCREDAALRVKTTDGGFVALSTLEDGSLVLTPTSDEGYTFTGWRTEDGNAVDLAAGFDSRVTLIACFDVLQ